VKPSRWILAVCTLGVALLMVLPAADALDAGFSDADAPVFLAAPSLSRARSLAPLVVSASVPGESVPQLSSGSTRLVASSKYSPLAKFAENRQPLLCTFLI